MVEKGYWWSVDVGWVGELGTYVESSLATKWFRFPHTKGRLGRARMGY